MTANVQIENSPRQKMTTHTDARAACILLGTQAGNSTHNWAYSPHSSAVQTYEYARVNPTEGAQSTARDGGVVPLAAITLLLSPTSAFCITESDVLRSRKVLKNALLTSLYLVLYDKDGSRYASVGIEKQIVSQQFEACPVAGSAL